jgi:uncharacterized Tic20 family protein
LRTLQRIETGKTEPRGQTLRLIAKALDTPLEDFLGAAVVTHTYEDDTRFLQTMNLSALTFWFIPLGNIFVPLILWGIKQEKTPAANELRKRLISFQVIWTLATYGYAYIGIIMHHVTLPLGISNLQLILGLCLLNSATILIASYQIRRGSEKVYTLGLPVLG